MADGKWIEGLSPEMDIAWAAREVLVVRFQVVRHYLPLAVEKSYEDAEYIHQLRVSTRRAAAALRAFADFLPRKHLRSIKDALRGIRQAAGEARDWDVFVLALPGMKPLTLAAGKPALDFLLGYAMGEREAVQARLVEEVHSAVAKLEKECEELPDLADGDTAGDTLGDLAASQVGQLLSSLTAAVEENPSDPIELHKLRILAKRARYALEIFADCFPPFFKDSVYPAVENVQELLGEIQDATVGIARLGALRDHVKKAMPAEWPRLQKGIAGLMQSLRNKVPAGRKAFQKWRTMWLEMVKDLKVEVAVAAVTA